MIYKTYHVCEHLLVAEILFRHDFGIDIEIDDLFDEADKFFPGHLFEIERLMLLSENPIKHVSGSLLLTYVIDFILEAREDVGGKAIVIDSSNQPKVIKFNKENKFVPFGEIITDKLGQTYQQMYLDLEDYPNQLYYSNDQVGYGYVSEPSPLYLIA